MLIVEQLGLLYETGWGGLAGLENEGVVIGAWQLTGFAGDVKLGVLVVATYILQVCFLLQSSLLSHLNIKIVID